jgi:NDP-sugar pyrophosphorylase family protein
MIRRGRTVRSYPFDGLWLDIGRQEDYGRAVETFAAERARFLPDA